MSIYKEPILKYHTNDIVDNMNEKDIGKLAINDALRLSFYK